MRIEVGSKNRVPGYKEGLQNQKRQECGNRQILYVLIHRYTHTRYAASALEFNPLSARGLSRHREAHSQPTLSENQSRENEKRQPDRKQRGGGPNPC